ncbi:metalloregulator ArsR/SmtB family transcription factor [Actinokineospora sp. PR83]|uniref:ArsR/SmtB family transcription factor n=1 Tax=Actinokineospora sp. PR83 TaxID=2884908 RepID=UPI001F42BE59|nr:metalloregulator ArsR/SmtB family transcription factor [Actinokineospora sp. PR83]MCG8917712.1 metalloregulator ArsR/SmtB family transcription factor [Actinokineospora sp. PR83]
MTNADKQTPTPVAITLPAAEPANVVDQAEAETAAALFKALADPVRVRLVSMVRHSPGGEACFCDLAEEFDMPQPSLSHHLRVLVAAGILARERRGTWSWYTACPQPLAMLGDLLRAGGPLAGPARLTGADRGQRC